MDLILGHPRRNDKLFDPNDEWHLNWASLAVIVPIIIRRQRCSKEYCWYEATFNGASTVNFYEVFTSVRGVETAYISTTTTSCLQA